MIVANIGEDARGIMPVYNRITGLEKAQHEETRKQKKAEIRRDLL